MDRWVWPVTQENWDVVRNYSIWAVNEEHKTKRIKIDDYILFYVNGTGLFRGIYQVTSTWYKSDKLVWSDEIKSKKKIYSYECKLRPFLIKDVIFKNIRSEHTEQEYTLVAPGSIVDMIWETRIGSMGTIKYAFEVQSKGSVKSLINNLVQSMNDPAVKKVVAVSDAKQLDKIRDMVENTNAYTNVAKSMFVFLDVKMIGEFLALVPQLNRFKKMLSV